MSSFYIGVAGALWAFLRLGSWEPLAFDINRSFQILFMVIIGGLGSILGSFLGAAFIVLTPIFLNQLPGLLGVPMSTALIAWMSFRPALPRWLVWTVILGNFAWAAKSVLLVFSAWVAPTAYGIAFVLAQAAAVALFAELQYLGLKRSQ